MLAIASVLFLTAATPDMVIQPLPADLPEDVTLPSSAVSLGVQVENSWGVDTPIQGVMLIDPSQEQGCSLYVSAPQGGIPRWTPFDYDMGFCLDYLFVDAAPESPGVLASTWGDVKARYR
jgi:hypothetical protein